MNITGKQKTLLMATGWMLVGTVALVIGAQKFYSAAEVSLVDSNQPVQSEKQATGKELAALKSDMAHLKQDKELAALKNDMARLKQDKQELQRVSSTMMHELALLRLQFEKFLAAKQESPEIPASVEDGPVVSEENELTPEEEQQRIDDRVKAQVALIEQTMLEEGPDPQWTATAQQSLYEAFQNVDLQDMYLEEAECTATLCRLKLTFDESADPGEAFRKMTNAIPWEGAGFSRIDDETGEVEVYVARQGYSLPKYAQ
jgi:hypothetical protein